MTGAHVHLALTHIPVLGILAGTLLLGYAFFSKRLEPLRISLAVFILSGITAVVVYLTGEAAEEIVEEMAGVSEAAIERHEEFAVVALVAAIILGVIALADLMLSRKKLPQWLVGSTLILAVVATGIMAWTANLGGQINHPEIRSDATSQNAGGEGEDEHDD